MNEFTVWDEKTQKFYYSNDEAYVLKEIDSILYLVEMDNFYNNKDIEESIIGEAMPYIGKTDIEGNKIYADSSIVEFEHPYLLMDIKRVGCFKYDADSLRYKIWNPNNKINTMICYGDEVLNLKIIGTLQENKELLDG